VVVATEDELATGKHSPPPIIKPHETTEEKGYGGEGKNLQGNVGLAAGGTAITKKATKKANRTEKPASKL